jgi:hypothetical protein
VPDRDRQPTKGLKSIAAIDFGASVEAPNTLATKLGANTIKPIKIPFSTFKVFSRVDPRRQLLRRPNQQRLERRKIHDGREWHRPFTPN